MFNVYDYMYIREHIFWYRQFVANEFNHYHYQSPSALILLGTNDFSRGLYRETYYIEQFVSPMFKKRKSFHGKRVASDSQSCVKEERHLFRLGSRAACRLFRWNAGRTWTAASWAPPLNGGSPQRGWNYDDVCHRERGNTRGQKLWIAHNGHIVTACIHKRCRSKREQPAARPRAKNRLGEPGETCSIILRRNDVIIKGHPVAESCSMTHRLSSS